MRVRGSSRASRTDEGGIQTVGNVPVLCSRFIPLASSLSLLLTLPIISFASRALTSCGFPPPSSISSNIQYQFPTVSTATGACRYHRVIKFLILPLACRNRLPYHFSPSVFSTLPQMYV